MRSPAPAGPRIPAVTQGNLPLLLAFAWLWLSPLVHFWGAVWGPFRPFGDPQGDLAPSLGWFVAGLAVCFTPCALPMAYFKGWEGEHRARVFEAFGIRTFKRFATNGDLVNRWARRKDARHRVVRDEASARAWAHAARGAERNHLVFFLMGLLTTVYALRIGWHGWALALTASNVVFNVYPVLLQRYNRLRIARICPLWALPEDARAGPG